MRTFAIALALSGLCAAGPALAQIESVDPDEGFVVDAPEGNRLVERLADPVAQEQLATSVAVMGEILLDLPLAPLAQALADAGVETADDIPADTTLRKLAPGAGRVPEEVAERLPQAMGAMASMARGMEAMLPAFREMADRMKDALPPELAGQD